MLTERGWAVSGTGIALALLWYLFGEFELGVAALLLLAAVFTSLVFVAGRRPRLEVTRRTTPTGVHDGGHASVGLRLRNRGRVLGNISLIDEVRGLGTAEFAAARFPARSELTAHYRVMCRPRGMYPIGPAKVRASDPLGLASVSLSVGNVDVLAVYPAVEDLDGLPGVPGRNPAIDARRPEHSQRGGEDFYTLREYQQGDDIRRVHWPSSARRDRLMIRQLETPWQETSLVFLDVRASSYPDEDAFEASVSAAASATRHLVRNAFETEVWAGESTATASESDRGYAVAMERLAQVQPRNDIHLGAVAAGLRHQGGGGILVLVTGHPDEELLGMARVLSASYPTAILMASAAGSDVDLFHRSGVVTVTPGASGSWAEAWNRSMRTGWHVASAGS